MGRFIDMYGPGTTSADPSKTTADSLNRAREERLRSTPIPLAPSSRPTTPKEVVTYGSPGQIDQTGRFTPIKRIPLGAYEQKMLAESENNVNTGLDMITQMKKLLPLNDLAYSGGLPGVRKAIGSLIGSEDPSYLATEEMDNILNRFAASQLKSTFPGSVTEGERKFLLQLQGSSSLPRGVRARIWANAGPVISNLVSRNAKKIEAIKGGYYATRDPVLVNAPKPGGR